MVHRLSETPVPNPAGKTLYLCARSGLYRIRLNIAGVRWDKPQKTTDTFVPFVPLCGSLWLIFSQRARAFNVS